MQYTSTFKHRLIYIFRVNDPAHANCLKIGETTAPDGFFGPNSTELNAAAKQRIKHITQTAGVKYELLYTELTAYTKNGRLSSFNDKQVHEVLKRSGIKNKIFDLEDGKATEWFICDLETAKNAIKAVKNGDSSLDKNKISTKKSPIDFRPEQKNAIAQTIRVFKKGNKMLWNAKMRMGKTLASLQVVKEMDIRRTIIVTHRPVVIDGWSKDFEKIFFESDTNWRFGSREIGKKSIAELERSGKNYIYFASIQDLRGSSRVGGDFDKNDDVFDTDWDLLIIDEAHEGTQTDKWQNTQRELLKPNTKLLNLSGTPFNLLENDKDYNDENTFTWDYVMEQRAKQEWAVNHPGDHNPYEELPKLNILTFNLGKLASEYQDEDKAFNFTEFFKTDDKGNFVYKSDIANFLDIISSDDEETLYPFSCQDYRNFFHHTFWILPGVKEGKAMAEMLRSHSVFGAYTIVNVCGTEDEETSGDPLEEVRKAIGSTPENTYTITLSCGKLTTGVTVREWTAVLYLAGSKNTSPASYMQTIFRVQSPGNIGGKMKTDCYVFDFAPDRTLKMVAETAKVSAKAGDSTREDKIILGDFLNFCPIISYDGTEMKPYNVDQMMQQLKRVYVDKVVNTGFEDGHLYSNKLYNLSIVELENFANLREIIGETKANKITKSIDINKQRFDHEDIEKAKQKAKKEGKKYSQQELEQLAEQLKKRRQREAAVTILRGISIRMPLLLFGAKLDREDENISLDRFVELVDDNSWAEFMPMGVTKDKFAVFKKYYDEDIFSAAGKQIRALALAADRMPVLQRIKHIAAIFDSFRNPDKETVLTPWRVVNMHLSDTVGGYCFYDDFGISKEDAVLSNEPHFVDRGLVSQRIFENANAKILEINSKSGLYPLYMAYGVFRNRLRIAKSMKRNLFNTVTIDEEQQIWRDVLAENIFVICKTEMARSITQRTLAGFTGAKVNTHVYDNLLEQITKYQTQFIKTLLSGGIFPQIKDKMKFTAIVGNPPYQMMDGGGNASAINIYNYFVDISRAIAPQYISMIMPARWYAGGKGLDDFRTSMLQDRRIERMYDYPNPKDCFPNTNISGGVCYFLWNWDYNGDCQYTNVVNGNKETSHRNLNENEVFVRYNNAVTIIRKVSKKNFESISSIVYARNPFDLDSSVRGDAEPKKDDDIKVFTSKGEGYLRKTAVTSNTDLIGKYKLSMGKVLSGHIGETDESGQVKVIATVRAICPNEVTTDSYLVIGAFRTKKEATNILSYFKTKLLRFLLLQSLVSMNISRGNFRFVPLQDFTSKSDIDWSVSVSDIDRQLYKKYELTRDEIEFVEGMIKPME